jgi:hypothetical protein
VSRARSPGSASSVCSQRRSDQPQRLLDSNLDCHRNSRPPAAEFEVRRRAGERTSWATARTNGWVRRVP